ncbi:hypothetical protein [Neorhodopirellula pilleata]|uniref:hypothetical protein n=1 Tax=Neorhodopirellula pilleata TaxID=2714738 RepID=UPI0018CF2E29|nr:hypothetical protein [Neorhodopirellula pilleata]
MSPWKTDWFGFQPIPEIDAGNIDAGNIDSGNIDDRELVAITEHKDVAEWSFKPRVAG